MGKHIVIIGIRGSGKSTIGRLLASAMGAEFIDIDKELIKVADVEKMIDMIKQKGKLWISEKEHELLEKFLLSNKKYVISTGGRIFSHEFPEVKAENFKIVRQYATAVLPLASEEEMWKRISADQHKEHAHLDEEKLWQNFKESLDFIDTYKKAADIIVVTDGKTPEESVDEIIKFLK
jgi:shikimate kinase